MSRSFAYLPDAARQADNVIDLRHRAGSRFRRRTSITLIGNRVSALCAPFEGACAQTQDNIVSVSGSGPLGIDICLCVHKRSCMLWLGGWHDEMPDADLALTYIARAIDGRLRLKVQCTAGRRPHRWTVECRNDDGTWIEEAFTCGVRMWRRRRESEIYLRNVFSAAPNAGRTQSAA